MKDIIYRTEFYQINNACIEVRKKLGNGFLEKVYENALKYELALRSFKVETQKEIEIFYKNVLVGSYYADLVVDDKIIIELKCASGITPAHKSQLLNYLKATGYKLGIIINFPNEITGFQIKRIPNFIEN